MNKKQILCLICLTFLMSCTEENVNISKEVAVAVVEGTTATAINTIDITANAVNTINDSSTSSGDKVLATAVAAATITETVANNSKKTTKKFNDVLKTNKTEIITEISK